MTIRRQLVISLLLLVFFLVAGTFPGCTESNSGSGVPLMIHEKSMRVEPGSLWSIPVYDGTSLVLSTEVIGPEGGI